MKATSKEITIASCMFFIGAIAGLLLWYYVDNTERKFIVGGNFSYHRYRPDSLTGMDDTTVTSYRIDKSGAFAVKRWTQKKQEAKDPVFEKIINDAYSNPNSWSYHSSNFCIDKIFEPAGIYVGVYEDRIYFGRNQHLYYTLSQQLRVDSLSKWFAQYKKGQAERELIQLKKRLVAN